MEQAISKLARRIRPTANFMLLGLSLLLTACGRHDAKLIAQIPGTWTQEESGKIEFTSKMTIATNGSFSDIRVGTQSHDTNTFAGTWRINNGVMSMTCTNRDGTNQQAPLGAFFTSRIVRLDHHYWYYELDGQTKYFAR